MDTVRDRARVEFPAIYITLFSMIQAIALETLVSRVDEVRPPLQLDEATVWLQALLMIHTIIFVWVASAWLVIMLRWVPGLLEMLLPFGVAIAQFAAVAWIGPDTQDLWFLTIGAGYGFGAVTWRTFVRRAKAENAEVIRQYHVGRIAWPMFIIAAVCVPAGILTRVLVMGKPGVLTMAIVANFVLLGATADLAHRWGRMTASSER